MKYSELISFKPIESTIQLLETADKKVAQDMVQTYVMSDKMAENIKATVIDQLQMEEVVDNKAVMIVGNYGTGKSHLMSVISAIATDADNLQFAQNKGFAKDMEIVAGKFEVLRLKVDGLTMPLREIILAEIEDDFAKRGLDYSVPDLNNVRDNARLIKDVMQVFQSKYSDKGYLIVIDELLSYLTSRDEKQIVLDLAFLQSMAEMCSKSRIRLICGVQEKVFDNPRFSFVSETLKKVGDRFTQIVITKEATAFVVSERILKKTSEQKAMIRAHLEKFSGLYGGMSSKMEDFVDLFPIHPSYIDVFNKIYVIENRHTVKRMLTVAHGTFCLIDTGDAVIRGFATGGGSFNVAEFAMRLNIVGVGRFAISLYGEVDRGVQKNKEEENVYFLMRERIIIEDYIEGLKYLSDIYDDRDLLTFVDDLKNSDMYKTAFTKSAELAKKRNVPANEILESKADIDSYFRGGN